MTTDTPITNGREQASDEWLREMRELEAEAYDDGYAYSACDVSATALPAAPSPPQRQPHPRPAREQPMAKGRGPEGQPAGVHRDSQPSWIARLTFGRVWRTWPKW